MSTPREPGTPITVTWTRGGHAELLSTDGHHATWLSTAPAPPGTPLEGSTPEGQRLQLKVRGCKRVEESPPRYQIDGRFFNMSKEQRAWLGH